MPDSTPAYPSAEWDSAAPEALSLDSARLESAAAILGRPQSNALAFLVVRGGKIAFERYFGGGQADVRLHLFSVTKSILSALIGIALEEGRLPSVEQPVADFFPELDHQPGSPWSQLTLRHLLSMTSGLLWPLSHHAAEPMVARLRLAPDWGRFILDVPVRREQIGTFHYCSASSHLLSVILSRAAGQNACAYAAARLFAPLGINPPSCGQEWENDPQGCSLGGWGLHLTARELARFGWLYLCGGSWQGAQLVPRSWVQASTRLADGYPSGYGYHWWLRRGKGQAVFAAIGRGGQYLFCVPNLDLAAVILSEPANRWPDRWEILDLLVAASH